MFWTNLALILEAINIFHNILSLCNNGRGWRVQECYVTFLQGTTTSLFPQTTLSLSYTSKKLKSLAICILMLNRQWVFRGVWMVHCVETNESSGLIDVFFLYYLFTNYTLIKDHFLKNSKNLQADNFNNTSIAPFYNQSEKKPCLFIQ